MFPIESTTLEGHQIFARLRSDYLRKVRYLAADMVDMNPEDGSLDQPTIDFLDDMNELSERYKKMHRALTLLEQGGALHDV